MRRVIPLAAVALLVLLAGCVGPFADDPETETSGMPNDTPSAGTPSPPDSTASPSGRSVPTDRPTPTAGGTPTPPPDLSDDNPFGQRVVPVRVEDTVGDGRNATALVATAIDYWNVRMERYTAFDYRFELADDPDDARVAVRFVDAIAECGRDHDERTVGCAPLLEADSTAPDVADVRIEMHGSNSAVVGTIEHELGHVLGLRHDDEPAVVMTYRTDEPVTDATERAVPWYTNELSVYVDHGSLDGERAAIERQVGHALEYYNEGAAGTIPDNVTFARTDHEASADVVVTNADTYRCGGVSGRSQMSLEYRNLDGDRAAEMYSRLIVCVDVDEEAVGWHVGNWLGRGMGLAESERAPPFRDGREQRNDWWE